MKFCYTIEASIGAYQDPDDNIQRFSVERYNQVGQKLIISLQNLFAISHKERGFLSTLYGTSIVNTNHALQSVDHRIIDMHYKEVFKELEHEQATCEPVIEGGSDSESSEDDLPVEKKKLVVTNIKKLLNNFVQMETNNNKFNKKAKRRKKIGKFRKREKLKILKKSF